MVREQDHRWRGLTRTSLDPLCATDGPDDAFETAWRRAFGRRLLMMGALLVLWTAGIEARLTYLQIVRHDDYLARANDQQRRVEALAPKRANIVDRNGEVLAYSVDVDSVVANPRQLEDPAAAATAMCHVFADCSRSDLATMTAQLSKSSAYARVRRAVSPEQARAIMALELPGVRLESETKRYYPKGPLAAHVLGFVGTENVGLAGVEQAFDSQIHGKAGRALRVIDANQKGVDRIVLQEPTAGATLELTIDQTLQYFGEREVQRAVLEHAATAGTLIAMDPTDGSILTMANYPPYDPNKFGAVDDDIRRNRATQEIYEPGSTFKIVTASAAIEEGVLTPSDEIDTSPGWIRLPGNRIVNDEHPYGLLTFENVIVKSSNVGAIKTGQMVGAERLSRYVRRFGFGEDHAPDFRGSSRGIVYRPEDLDENALASVSMGYQVGVTPLQMVTAVAAVANGGLLFQPRIVNAITRDGRRDVIDPVLLRTAIAPTTAATLTTIMEGVVGHGTATRAQIEGYQVAGKTGTAQKVINGHYSETDHTGSFVGFVPSRRPALVVLVVIDQPRRGGFYGGVVAAPAFQRFATEALRYLGIPRTINPIPPIVVSPDSALLAQAARPATEQPAVVLVSGQLVMPDVVGLGARDATRVLTKAGLITQLIGDGAVVEQSPAPGTPVDRGDTSILRLDRTRPLSGDGGGR